jgi:hypothetical protein
MLRVSNLQGCLFSTALEAVSCKRAAWGQPVACDGGRMLITPSALYDRAIRLAALDFSKKKDSSLRATTINTSGPPLQVSDLLLHLQIHTDDCSPTLPLLIYEPSHSAIAIAL